MTLEAIIGTYGYLFLMVGTFFEGETTLVLAGFAAQLGYLDLPWVIALAFIGTLIIDQSFFYLGRRHSAYFHALIAKSPLWQGRILRVERLVERHRTPLILAFRFLYGLRMVAPFVMGTSRIPARTFLLLNCISAMIWAVGVGMTGYLFGHLLATLAGSIKGFEGRIMALIAIGGGFIWLVYFLLARRHRPKRPTPS